MSRLGNVFKKKLNQREFVYKESYWSDMEKMLDSNSGTIAHHKVSGLGKFLSSIAVLATVGGIIAYFLVDTNTPERVLNKERIPSEKGLENVVSTSDKIKLTAQNNEIEPLIPKDKNSYYSSLPSTENSVKEKTSPIEKNQSNTDSNNEARATVKNESNIAEQLAAVSHTKTTTIEKSVQNEIKRNPVNTSEVADAFVAESFKKEATINTLYKLNKDELNNQNQPLAELKLISASKTSEAKIGETETQKTSQLDASNEATNSVENATNALISQKKPLMDVDEASLLASNSKILSETSKSFTPFGSNNSSDNTLNTGKKESNTIALLVSTLFSQFPTNYANSEVVSNEQSVSFSKAKNIKYQIGLYGGSMSVSKKLSSRNTAVSDYIARRNSEEKNSYNINAGFDFSLNYKNWLVTTGLNYHTQGEITDYKAEFLQWVKRNNTNYFYKDTSYWKYTQKDFSVTVDSSYWTTKQESVQYWNDSTQKYDTTIINVSEYVVNNLTKKLFHVTDSALIDTIDTTTITSIDSLQQLVSDASLKPTKTKTSFTYIEIPLMIGYEFPINRWVLAVSTGAGLGFLTKQTATYLKQDLSGVVPIQRMNSTKLMINYLAKIDVKYQLTLDWHISVSPFYRLNLNSVFRKSEVEQKYQNIGINIGIGFRF